MLLHSISLAIGMIALTILVVSVGVGVRYVRDVRSLDKPAEERMTTTYGLLGALGTIISTIMTIVFMSGPLGYFGIVGSIARAVEILVGNLIIAALVFIFLRVRHIQHAAYEVDTTEAKNQVIGAGIVLVLAAVVMLGVTKITPEPLSEVPQPVPTQLVANPTAATPTNTPTPLPPTLAPSRTPFVPPTWTPSPPSVLPAECNKVTRLGSNLTDLEAEGWTGWACGSYVLFVDNKGHEWCKIGSKDTFVCVHRGVTMENVEGRPRFKSNEVPTSTPLPTMVPTSTPTVVPKVTPETGCVMIEPLSIRSPLEERGWRGWTCNSKTVTITGPDGFVRAQLRQSMAMIFEGGIVCNKNGFPLFELGAELQLCK